MRGIDAENSQCLRLRDEFKLFERQFERAILGMTLHVGIELGGGKTAADHVAFELGHVDAVGGKAAERFRSDEDCVLTDSGAPPFPLEA
jgi:hypothetical protein